MFLVEKKEYVGIFCFFRPISTRLIRIPYILNYAFLVCFKYKCLMPYNKLFNKLACLVYTEKYWTSVFLTSRSIFLCTDLVFGSVEVIHDPNQRKTSYMHAEYFEIFPKHWYQSTGIRIYIISKY